MSERPRWRLFGTTADLGLAVTAPTLPGLLEGAALGLAGAVCDRRRVRPRLGRTVTIRAEGPEALLVAWLNELIFLFDAKGFLLRDCRVELAGPLALAAHLRGEPFDPARHRIGAYVKAATLHRLLVERGRGGWRARVVLDV
jgi:SHS2 domain-containing protein